jgi:uncharacterized protein (TIGR02145 family)
VSHEPGENESTDKTMSIRNRIVAIALSIVVGTASAACFARTSAEDQDASGAMYSFKRMADGKEWTTENLNVDTGGTYCYEDSELNCGRYGRLYTWDSAARACQLLGDGWRLPTNDEWRQLAKHYGGLREESDDSGKAAYTALLTGGSSGFNAVLGGGRVSDDEQYARLEAHGLYWTASETGATSAWLYNFGKGGSSLNRHRNGNKQMAVSVRCVRD